MNTSNVLTARWIGVVVATTAICLSLATSRSGAEESSEPRIQSRLSNFARLNSARAATMANYEKLEEEQKALFNAATVKQAEGKGLVEEQMRVSQQLQDVQAQLLQLDGLIANELQNNKGRANALTNQYTLQINQISLQTIPLQQRLAALSVRIRELKAQIDGMEREHRDKEAAKTTTRTKADIHWSEWQLLIDPLGKLSRKEHEAAMKLLSDAIAKDATHGGALLARAAAYRRLGQLTEALADLTSAVNLGQPYAVTALSMRGHALIANDKQREGLADYALALKLDKKSTPLYLLRGLSQAEQAKFPLAEKDFRFASQLGATVDGNRLLALRLSASEDTKHHDAKHAIEAAKKAVELSKQLDWSCYDALGAAYAEGGQWDEAIEAAKQAADLAYDDHRERCLEHVKLYEAKKPLRMSWKL